MTVKQIEGMIKCLKDNNIKDIKNEIKIEIKEDCIHDSIIANILRYKHGKWVLIKTIKELADCFKISNCNEMDNDTNYSNYNEPDNDIIDEELLDEIEQIKIF